MSEEKEQIIISLDSEERLKDCDARYVHTIFEGNVSGIRVFPACQLFRFNPVTLTPIELNEAVQMWMDRPRSIPEDMVTQLHIKDAEIARLKNQCNDKDHILQDRWNRIEVDENRIAYLKKLSTMQKATIDALGKEFREA